VNRITLCTSDDNESAVACSLNKNREKKSAEVQSRVTDRPSILRSKFMTSQGSTARAMNIGHRIDGPAQEIRVGSAGY